MITHTVCFTLRHDAGAAAEDAFISAARATLTTIPEVHNFIVNRQVSTHSTFRFQFAMTFDDEAAYAAYNAHPTHREFVAARWNTEVEHFQEFDFEELVP